MYVTIYVLYYLLHTLSSLSIHIGKSLIKLSGGRPGKSTHTRVGAGRKKVNIAESSKSVQYSRANQIINLAEGNIELLEKAVNLAKKRQKRLNNPVQENDISDCNQECHTKETALSFFIDNNYTQNTWQSLRNDCKARKVKIYLSYKHIRSAKKDCLVTACSKTEI